MPEAEVVFTSLIKILDFVAYIVSMAKDKNSLVACRADAAVRSDGQVLYHTVPVMPPVTRHISDSRS